MKHLKIYSTLLILLLLTAATPPKVKWQKFKSKEGKISASFPGEFKETVTSGTTGNTHKFVAEKNSNNFLLSYTIHNIELLNPSSLQETSLVAFAQQLNGVIKNKRDWSINGKRGIIADVEFDISGSKAKCEYRVLINNNIQYQVMLAASVANYDKALASKFFNSVKIK